MKSCPSCGLKYRDDEERCFVDGAGLEPVADARIGALLKGRYQVESVLGEGGMAVVYRARNTLVERPVAVKIMNAHLASDAGLKERFRREAKNAAAVAHPNIIDIYDYGETDDGTPFLVMELLDGQPLDTVIASGPLPAAQVAALGAQIARGLARAHDFSVIHRDLKPENIFVCRGADGRLGVAKILDFGIARSMQDSRLTNAGEIFGTPQYMAPERITTTEAGASVDLYALGVILFEMVTGRLPFESKDLPGFFIKHLQDAPPRPSQLVPDIPRRLEELILKLLEKKVEDRPVDAHAVVKMLEPLVPKGAEAMPAVVAPSPRRESAAPTLPPTTLERWAQRTAVFDQMLVRAYPQANAPPNMVAALAEIRRILMRMNELRSSGLKEQRKLEQMEQHAKEGRERLGHAVHVLAEDLSTARETLRGAQRDVAPYFEADTSAKQAYARAHEKMAGLGGGRPIEEPTQAVVTAAREVADALDRWSLAYGAADKARRWVDAKQREVADLEFQVDALRAQLERVETSYENERGASEEALRVSGEEISRLDQRLMELGASFVAPLRTHHGLGDLFARLEQEGTPAAGLTR